MVLKRQFPACIVFILLLCKYGVKSTCDMCTFTDQDDSSTTSCKVYGQLGDRILIGWDRASQDCLDEFQIKDEAIDPDQLTSIFPNTDGTNGNVNSFVNYLRFDTGSVVDGIKISFPQFFQEDAQTNTVSLLDTITVDGTTYDCKTSASDCYNAMKTYFTTDPGATEMANIGKSLYDQSKVSREKEQSFVRIRLCAETASDVCEPLASQVAAFKANHTSKNCSAFGLGPAGVSIPGCASNNSTGSSTTSSSTSKGTSSAPLPTIWKINTFTISRFAPNLFMIMYLAYVIM